MILNREDSIYAATKLMKYFRDFNRIDDYFRARKIERVKDIPSPLPGMSMEDDLFQDYDMHPEDMNFKVYQIPNKLFESFAKSDSPQPVSKTDCATIIFLGI